MKALALYFALICQIAGLQTMAQTQESGSTATSSQSPNGAKAQSATEENKPTDGKKPKKVWTNEEMGSLQGTVSVVGTKRPGTLAANSTA